MGKSQRDKGARREREFAKLIGGSRVPLSGAMDGYSNDVKGLGLEWEVKARKSGFKTLYDWIEDKRENPDAVALKVDNKPWLVCMTLDKFLEVVNQDKGVEQMEKTKIYVWDRIEGNDRVIDIYFSRPEKFSYIDWI